MGLAIGKSIEEKYRKQGLIRPLTEKELETRKKAKIFGIITVILGLLALLTLFILSR